MRTKINNGNRGQRLDRLCKRYECEDFYELIVNSEINGHRDQAIEYFNMMKGEDQQRFIMGYYIMYGEYGGCAMNAIVNGLWEK